MPKDLREIAEEQGLIDDLTILGEELRLEGILTAFTNFCQEEEPKKHQDPFHIPDEFESLVERVTEYTVGLINNYERDSFKLLFVTLEALEFLPAKDKEIYINQFRSFVEKEGKCQNQDCVMSHIIKDVLSRLGAKYHLLFDGLNNGEAKSTHPRYQLQVSELKEDLQRVMEYTKEKLAQSNKFDVRAKNISYEECFPNNKIDFSRFTPEYVINLIETQQVPQKLIDEFGIPIGMAIRGNKNTDSNTMVLYFGDPNNPESLRVDHNKIDSRASSFYLGLSSQITNPPPVLAEATRKARDTLANPLSFL